MNHETSENVKFIPKMHNTFSSSIFDQKKCTEINHKTNLGY